MENVADDATGISLQQHLESQMDDPLCFSWFANRSKLNQQEIRATLSLSMNMLRFWLCTFPITVIGILIFWCIRLQSNCSIVYHINP
jgi:5-hydroxytryptamine receptor 1